MRHALVEFLLIAIPKMIGGFGTLAFNIVFLRFLGPDSYGIYALCLAGITLADAVCGSAFDMGVLRLAPLYRLSDPARSYGIEKSALILKCSLALFVLALIATFSGPLSRRFLGLEDRTPLLVISVLAALGLLAVRSIQSHLQVDRKFVTYGCLELVNCGIKFGGITLLLLSSRLTPESILAFNALAPIATFLGSIRAFGGDLLRRYPDQSGATRELIGFVKWALLTYSITSIMSRLDLILLSSSAGLSEIGIYSGGQNFTLIVELFGSYLAVILGPRVIPAMRAGEFAALFKKVVLACTVLALATYASWLLGRDIFARTVLPASFARSAEVITILLPGALAAMVFFPIINTFVMFVRPTFIVTLECATLPLVLPLYYYAVRTHGATGAAWVNSGSRLAKLLVTAVMAWRWSNLPPHVIGLTEKLPDYTERQKSEQEALPTDREAQGWISESEP